jgi:plasmid rolling circle replication initiator protein Rep
MKSLVCQEENLTKKLQFNDGLEQDKIKKRSDLERKIIEDFARVNNIRGSYAYNPLEAEILQKFSPKKVFSTMLARSYARLGYENKAFRVSECGSFLEFAVQGEKSVRKSVKNATNLVVDTVEYNAKKLINANFCKDKLCAMCSWRRSLKIFGQVSQIMDLIENDFVFVFLTLTIRNVPGSGLIEAIDELNYSWHKFSGFKRIKNVMQGFFKAVEVTYNREKDDYHPHLHVILAVKRDYFRSDDYITHKEFRELWQKALGVDYLPIVDVRKCKSKETKANYTAVNSLKDAVREVAKYSVKATDFLLPNLDKRDEVINNLFIALNNRRMCSFGGVFLEARQKLKLDDCESGDLVFTDNEKLRNDVATMLYRYGWTCGAYKLIAIEKKVDVSIDCDE